MRKNPLNVLTLELLRAAVPRWNEYIQPICETYASTHPVASDMANIRIVMQNVKHWSYMPTLPLQVIVLIASDRIVFKAQMATAVAAIACMSHCHYLYIHILEYIREPHSLILACIFGGYRAAWILLEWYILSWRMWLWVHPFSQSPVPLSRSLR